jgi:hypothetical protein
LIYQYLLIVFVQIQIGGPPFQTPLPRRRHAPTMGA